MMKETLLPIILIIQISILPTFLIFTHARPESEDTARYFYGYEVDFNDNGTVQGHAERRSGHHTKGSYFVTLPNAEAHSDVQYIVNKKGYQPVVRIATKDAHSRVSSHFAMGKDAVSALKAMESEPNEPRPKEPKPLPNRLLTNEVMTPQPQRRGKILVRKHKIGSRPAGKVVKKPIHKATKLVSEDDVFNINDAAEEYFDGISEERINSSYIDFRDNSAKEAFQNIPEHVKVDEIISNSRPNIRQKSRALKHKVPEILISPGKQNSSEGHGSNSLPKINIEIVTEQFPPTIPKTEKSPDVSTEVNVFSSISVSYSSTTDKSLPENITEFSPYVQNEQRTRYDQSFGKATTISEAFLAPIQAGLLLYGDNTDPESENEFEDNILSDTIQNDQTVFNHIENRNKTASVETKGHKKDEEKPLKEIEKTVVESFYSNPVVEIVEKTVDGDPSIKYTDKTYYHSVERHVDGERPIIVTTPKDHVVQPSSIELNINSQKGATFPSYINTHMELFPPPPPYRPPIHPQKLKLPFVNFGNYNHGPMLPPPRPPPVSGHTFYRRPGNMFYATHTQHRPLTMLDHENCFNCAYKVIRDDYLGPVPPMNEVSVWNTVNVRQQRQLNVEAIPRMEYGFKPLLRPSIEINDEGLPLVKSQS